MSGRGEERALPNPPLQAAEGDKRIDWAKVRDDFPILRQQVHGKPLVYLDSANTGQKPQVVIDAVEEFLQVHVDHYPTAFGNMLPRGLDCLMGVPPRSEAVARFGEFHLEDR